MKRPNKIVGDGVIAIADGVIVIASADKLDSLDPF